MRGRTIVDQILTARQLFLPYGASPRMWRQFALVVALAPLVGPCGDTAVTANHTTHTIAADASSASPYCVYELDPEHRKVRAAGDTKSVKVKTSAKCPWTASASVS